MRNKMGLCSIAAAGLMILLLAACAAAEKEEKGKFYVVGMGPAGPDLTASGALSIVKNADVYLTSPGLPKRFDRFSEYIDPEKVAFDPWKPFMDKDVRQLKKDDYPAWQAHTEKHRKRIQAFVMDQINSGKTVVMMDGGDPCVYGPTLHRLLKGFDASLFEVIPGIGAFNAAGAALKASYTPEDVRFIMLTSPRSLFGENWEKDDGILKDLAKYKTNMVWYMSLGSVERVVKAMSEYYPPDLPIAIVYYAGYPDRQRVLKSSLKDILEDISEIDEQWLGLFVAGPIAGK